MVVFTCQKCNSTLKKNAVEKHNSCRPFFLTCIDCLKDFRGRDYDEHKTCITEMQKYGGLNVVVKPQGGKQEKWMEMARQALAKISHNPRYKNICLVLKSSPNIPRNRSKFHNFVQSTCSKIYKADIVNEIFDELSKEKNSKQETVERKPKNNNDSKPVANGVIEENEIIDLDELNSPDIEIKKKKKDRDLNTTNNETQQVDNKNKKVCEHVETSPFKPEQHTTLTNNDKFKKFKCERQLSNKLLSNMNEDEKWNLKNWCNIDQSEMTDQQNIENEENCKTIDENNEKVADVVDSNSSKLSKKELKKLKKQQKYIAEIAEIESCQPEQESTDIAQEEKPKKKKKKHNNAGDEAVIVAGTSPKRKQIEECVEDIGGKRIKLNETLIEEEIPSETRRKFKWGKVMKQILENSIDKEMSLKKLRKKILNQYSLNVGDDAPYEKLLGIFNKKVNSTVGIKVIKDRAQLVVE